MSTVKCQNKIINCIKIYIAAENKNLTNEVMTLKTDMTRFEENVQKLSTKATGIALNSHNQNTIKWYKLNKYLKYFLIVLGLFWDI